MADLIIHGCPLGQQISKCDDKLVKFFDSFYNNVSCGIKTTVSHQNNNVIYNYLVYENPGSKFIDYDGRPGSYFGMSLVFHNQYAKDSDKVFSLLKMTYDNYVKNKIIQELPNGSRKWLYKNISTPGDEIAKYVAQGLFKIIQTYPELKPVTMNLQPIQNQSQR